MTRIFILAYVALCVLDTAPVAAHDATPALLEMHALQDGRYAVTWKNPARTQPQLHLRPEFSTGCAYQVTRRESSATGAVQSEGVVACRDGLAGTKLEIEGLEATLSDVLVRVHHANGSLETHILRPTLTQVVLGGITTTSALAASYIALGATHVWSGADHVLFLLGLILIVKDVWTLVKTITTFTVAHSITLAAATLGIVDVSSKPIEFAIALSILALGPEILRARQGLRSLSIDKPWLLALCFGLVHGFGFAGGLSTAGLGPAEIPFALLFFNLGVEVAQLAAVLIVLLLIRSLRPFETRWPRQFMYLPAYIIGGAGAYWVIQNGVILAESLTWSI